MIILILILIKQKNHKLQEALDLSTRALSFNPDNHGLHFNAANIYGELGMFALSEKHFNQAIMLNPNKAKYYFNFAVLYHRQKKFDSAKVFYNKVLALNPDHVEARKQLKRLSLN